MSGVDGERPADEFDAWWQREQNPPCLLDGCEVDHDPREFPYTGGLQCSRTVAAGEHFAVSVTLEQSADELLCAHLHREVTLWVQCETLPPGEAPALAVALLQAQEQCERVRAVLAR